MKNRLNVYALLLASIMILASAGRLFAWGAAGSDGSYFGALQETAVFFNNSAATLVAGDVVILDTGANTGVSTGTTLGSYVRIAGEPLQAGSAQTDSILVVGVVKSTSVADQLPVVIVTKGPVNCNTDDSSDAVTNNTAVGVSGRAGFGEHGGGGTNLGISLEAGDGTDTGNNMIWINPTGAD